MVTTDQTGDRMRIQPSKRLRVLGRVAATWLLWAAACGGTGPAGPSELTSTAALVRELVASGATVSSAGMASADAFPFFSVRAERLVVNGEGVHVFEYPNSTRANADAARVAPAGTPIGQTQITWVDPPRFYRSSRLIVVYVGRSDDVAGRLEAVLGPPFAGVR